MDSPEAALTDRDTCMRKSTDNFRQITACVKAHEHRYTCDEDHMVCAAGREAVRKRGIEV